jgi:hypothetical protein
VLAIVHGPQAFEAHLSVTSFSEFISVLPNLLAKDFQMATTPDAEMFRAEFRTLPAGDVDIVLVIPDSNILLDYQRQKTLEAVLRFPSASLLFIVDGPLGAGNLMKIQQTLLKTNSVLPLIYATNSNISAADLLKKLQTLFRNRPSPEDILDTAISNIHEHSDKEKVVSMLASVIIDGGLDETTAIRHKNMKVCCSHDS